MRKKTHYVIRLHDNLDNQKIFAYIYICNIYIYIHGNDHVKTWPFPWMLAFSRPNALFTAKCNIFTASTFCQQCKVYGDRFSRNIFHGDIVFHGDGL